MKFQNLISIPSLFITLLVWYSVIILNPFVTPKRNAILNQHRFDLSIHVITFNRPMSLRRLLDSLARAHFHGASALLSISIEAGAPEEVYRICARFNWPHGRKTIRRRVIPSGLIPAVVESWYPSSETEFGLLLEDDAEVSPYFFTWVQAVFRSLQGNALLPPIFGISLYTPRVIETTNPYSHFYADQAFSTPLYLHQMPCSWGAVYFPKQWIFFHKYMNHRLSTNGSFLTVPGSRTNGWKDSWKKYFIEVAWAKGWFMVYPNYPNQTSFSTNHVEPGLHISSKDTLHSSQDYSVPVFATAPPMSFSAPKLPMLDPFNHAYNTNPRKILEREESFCFHRFHGFIGFPESKMSYKSNKVESGLRLLSGEELVSVPIQVGEKRGFFFTAALDFHGVLILCIVDPQSMQARTVLKLGRHVHDRNLYALHIANNSLAINLADSHGPAIWKVHLNASAAKYSLHLKQDGNLVVYTGCGCTNEPVWESTSSVVHLGEGMRKDNFCQSSKLVHYFLPPGKALSSRYLNTLLSEKGSSGHYIEAVMQTDGNFVLYRNPSDSGVKPVFNIQAPAFLPGNGDVHFTFEIDVDGNLRIVGHGDRRIVTLWQSNFHGNSSVPHFMHVDSEGVINVFQGYSLCEAGPKVWSSQPHRGQFSQNMEMLCQSPNDYQAGMLCGQASPDIYNFFSDPDSITVIISTTGVLERASLVQNVIVYLSSQAYVSCILLVWHKPFEPCPQDSIVNGKLVKYLVSFSDSLNNRFYPSIHVTTEAVLIVDDDIVIHHEDINLLFMTWQQFKDKIVGFFPRWVLPTETPRYLYQSEDHEIGGYSIMLTKAMMLHKRYLFHYNCREGCQMHAIVDQHINCEDLAMNFLVANRSGGPSSMFVQPLHPIGDYGKYLRGSLQKRTNHQDIRSQCLHHFESLFNFRLPKQIKSAHGQKSLGGVQVKLNSSYAGVDRHHVDCSQGVPQDGCFV